jgi:transposase
MHRFIAGADRMQQALLPQNLEDYVGEENPVRVIEVFIDELDLAALGFSGMTPAATGRPGYHPSTLLKIYLYGYLNRLQSSRRLEREAQRNIELMWLVGRLAPDFKTIADFRKDNGEAIRAVCGQFVGLLPSAQALYPCRCCDRRQQVQSGEQPRQELHGRQGHRADGAGRRQHRALPEGAGPGRTAKIAISPRTSRSD